MRISYATNFPPSAAVKAAKWPRRDSLKLNFHMRYRKTVWAALCSIFWIGGLSLLSNLNAFGQTVNRSHESPPPEHLLKTHCLACHRGTSAQGGFRLEGFLNGKEFASQPDRWKLIVDRVKNHEMPPQKAPMPSLDRREAFVTWAEAELKRAACSAGLQPGPSPIRRLNKQEYSASVRDLTGVQMDAGADLPADGAGGEGFDNAAETLFLSPIHAEKYLAAARTVLTAAFRDEKTKSRLLLATPNTTAVGAARLTPRAAAAISLRPFLRKAFRRDVQSADVESYLTLFDAARAKKLGFEDSVAFAMRAILLSPQFLFLSESPGTGTTPQKRDDFAFASRLSYFLWGTMPDTLLLDLASQGKLQQPEIVQWQIQRMLRHPRAHDFFKRFVEQWLGTRELGRLVKPDAKLFPDFQDEELRSDMAYQPIFFFQEIIQQDLSLLNLIDSRFTFVTQKMHRKLYAESLGIPNKELSEMMKRVDLPAKSDRGGLLGMPGILTVSSHPHRTSPVLRGKWLLDAMLGTPPPPPPPDVPELKQTAGSAKTLRAILTQHRENAVCASCHNRIDPLGFALENYDVLGRWRATEDGQPLDTTGELSDGTKFNGPRELKTALLQRKHLVIRNLTAKMLGYALGRGLILSDSCVVDAIVDQVAAHNYSGQTLIHAIVDSVPFRYRPPESSSTKIAPSIKMKEKGAVTAR
jgi:hypothetical protein